MATKAEIRAFADSLAKKPEQKQIAKDWGNALYAEAKKQNKATSSKQ